ncbi:hypothetical protein HDU91_000230 [Kappamyces sp. JEL0680]|nr:hypothetical protein HDU91_000230 [Kappamyces sp. JEL0680]
MFAVDVLGGVPLPNCPYPTSALPPDSQTAQYHNPTLSTSYFLFVLFFGSYGVLTLFKYNQVSIFNRHIDHPSIKNHEYALFYLILGISFAIDGIRYSLDFPHKAIDQTVRGYFNASLPNEDGSYVVGPGTMDSWLLLISACTRSAAVLFLSLALHHQITHRSSVATGSSGLQIPSPALSSRIADQEREPLLRSPAASQESQAANDLEPNLVEEDATEYGDSTTDHLRCIPRHVRSAIYTSALQYLQSIQFLLIVFFLLKTLVLLAVTDSARLAEPNAPDDTPVDMLALRADPWPWAFMLFSIFQLSPVFYFSWIIVKTPSLPENGPIQLHTRLSGPSLLSKTALSLGILLTVVFWMEPSVVFRFVDLASHHPRNEAYCVIPPWWWQRLKSDAINLIPAHGWASLMDLVQWLGGFGVFCIYVFMKAEYKRNADDWVMATVSEVQSTFGFR